MKHAIKTMMLIVVLMMSATVYVYAEGEPTIVINKIPQDVTKIEENSEGEFVEVPVVVGGSVTIGTITKNDGNTEWIVPLTVTPLTNYYTKKSQITAERMVDASSVARRVLATGLTIEGTDDEVNAETTYNIHIPLSYKGAYITVKFYKNTVTLTPITSLSQITEADGDYELTCDVDASSLPTTFPTTFTGTLDGGFYTIRNLSKPLFTTITGGTVRNVMLQDVRISQNGPVGAICGTANGTARIYNCGILPTNNNYASSAETSYLQSTGNTTGNTDSYCGGLVGYLDEYARVINCFSYANITGGTTVAGIVGYNTTATMQGNNQNNFNNNVKTMVVNCMFYGDITGGSTKYPVYGGLAFVNNDANKVNDYNYFCEEEATFDDNYTAIGDYNYSWPVAKKHLIRFEVYRNILNSNRRLCTWWVSGTYKKDSETDATDAEVERVGIAKWVLDQTIAPYPILKKWGKYYSTFDMDPDYVWNPKTKSKIARSIANPWEGKSYGTISVSINGGSNNSGASAFRNITITDMDTLGYDYCARKIQLPYYNEIFGNPNGATWAAKYANNYTSKVVTGWKVTAVNKDGKNHFVANWQNGYDFADRDCTDKDIYDTSGRVFAQGGYYYVPEGVTSITIEAYWGDAVYLCNSNRCLDKMNNGTSEFYVSGKLPEKVGGISTNPAVQTSLYDAKNALKKISDAQSPGETVYDQAIVLVGNYQDYSCHSNLTLSGNNYDTDARPFTIMSADFDFDNEPDFCFQAGMNGANRPNFQPIRFDFLMVPDITMAIRTVDLKYYGIRNICPQGHYEVTETSYMYVTQFEYDIRTNSNIYNKHEAPMILNGGEFMQIVSTHTFTKVNPLNTTATARADRTSYFLMGGKLYMKAFTPGTHVNTPSATRHCAVNAIGGEFPEFYLSGMFRSDFYNMTDNPHAYLDGGWFGTVAGAGMESVGAKDETNGGDVTFKINHSRIHEFYGGGINANRPVTGNIDVTIDNSIVHKYCGGPKLGDMSSSKSITTTATGTTFDQFFGGGNGGTNMLRENKFDGWQVTAPTKQDHSVWDDNTAGSNKKGGKFNAFTPFKYEEGKGYQAEFEFELLPIPAGDDTTVPRTYYHYASFSKTMVAPITNTITDCTFNGNFYGGGNLGAVGSPSDSTDPAVSSTLKGNTVVHGSVFGAGFSASIPSFKVHKKSPVVYPYRDFAGFIHDGSLDYDPREFAWIHVIPTEWGISPAPTTTNANRYFEYPVGSGKWYCYTPADMTGLGTVTGNVTLTIEGKTLVEGSVFGGGAQSAVDGNTTVNIMGNATVENEVFGGGDQGEVSGTSKVNVMYTE